MRKILILIAILGISAWLMAPTLLEKSMNQVQEHEPYPISAEAQALHNSLIVGDWHADSPLWNRDLLKRADRGHVDIPRLREGNVALQMFTTVTKTPRGQNYEKNSSEQGDNITLLALAQRWPPATWSSLKARALFQAEKLRKLAQRAPDEFMLLYDQGDLAKLLELRASGSSIVGGLIGTEGSHALDGDLAAVEDLYRAGFRMMSLQHFFDNELGGSLHGESGAGLTAFGRQALTSMLARGVMVDVSHSSENVVRDVLSLSAQPLLVSHTGFKGHCDSPRNISDHLMKAIAERGGLIAVGYWTAAVCGSSPAAVVDALRYGIDLVGEDHVALGSDYDGAIEAGFDTSELAALTQGMLDAGFTETEIRKVMGGNMVAFLQDNLPPPP